MSGFLCCSGRQDDLPPAADQSSRAVLSGVARYEVNAAFCATTNGNGAVPADLDFFQEKGSRFVEKESRFPEGGFPHHSQQPQFWLHPSSRAPPPPPPPVLPDVVGHSAVVVAASSSQQHTMSPEASSRPFW